MDIDWLVALEYLKVMLSAQIVIGVVVLSLACKFKRQIKGLIDRVGHIKFPGGELSATQRVQKPDEELRSKEGQLAVDDLDRTQIPDLSAPEDQIEQVKIALASERVAAALWEYRYLNYFLVYKTQNVLDWLGSQVQGVTYNNYDSVWITVIPNAIERATVIEALEAHHLVRHVGDLLKITDKGREYIQWRGPLKQNA